MNTYLKPVLLIGIVLITACRSARICRPVHAEEAALHYLIDSIYTTAYKDSVQIFINPKIVNPQESSFWLDIAPFFSDTTWVMETAKKLMETDESLTVFDCRKKYKYPLRGVKLKTPKGYRRLSWKAYATMDKKGMPTSILQIFCFAKYFGNKFYVEVSCYNDGHYLIILDDKLQLINWSYR